MRTPLLNLRVDVETKARWEASAREAGYSLAEYVRAAVDARVEMDAAPARKPRKKKSETPDLAASRMNPDLRGGKLVGGATARARTGMCEHRRPPETYCPKCGS